MATTQLADIYNPLTFGRKIQLAQLELNKFISSGVVIDDSAVQAQLSQGGNLGELAGLNPLTIDEPNYSSDDPGATSTPAKIDSNLQRYRLASMNKSWSTMDLARELALVDPVGGITGRIGKYWATNDEKRVIQSSLGILADNVANDSGDMLFSVATDAVGAVTDAERISADVVIDGEATLGDHAENLSAIAMHSSIYHRLRKQQLITFIQPANTNVRIPTYLGLTVIYDDSMPAVMGTNRITYTCILYARGVFAHAAGKVAKPSELEREASAGNGGGQDIIHSRRNELYHPMGFSFLSASVAGQSASQAELEDATNWNRIWSRKHVPMAFLQVND